MREKTVLLVLAIVFSMLLMCIPVKAWEYYDTTVTNPQHDLLVEEFGPRADHVQIIMYSDELAEFTALELGQLDMTDWPVDETHYLPWITSPKNNTIAVVDTGPAFAMFELDMQMNNDTNLYTMKYGVKGAVIGPNPAYTAPFGNPMADVWLRRAIASVCDRAYTVTQIVSGGKLPLLGAPLYTWATDPPYTGFGHPEINPTGVEKELTYLKTDGSADIALGNKFLDEHGYGTFSGGYRTKNGVAFELEIVVRQDHTLRKLFGDFVISLMTAAPPNGLGLKVKGKYDTAAGAKQYFMDQKAGHMYTGGWGLTIDPDQLYYLFHIYNYYHPGRPQNYCFYPGNDEKITVPYNGWQYNYTNVDGLKVTVDWGASPYDLDLSDYDKTFKAGDKVWKHPANYWAWEMMISTTSAHAQLCSRKCQEAQSFYAVGVPMWTDRQFSAFSRTYTGPETEYHDKPWKGVINGAGFGTWDKRSFYNMHTSGDTFGDGNMTIRWGFRQPTMSLNPIWAEWVWDWYVMDKAYDTLVQSDSYQTAIDVPTLATDWEVETWNASTLNLGICTKVTFHLRQDVFWSDGIPFTANDVVWTLGGPNAPGSLSNELVAKGLPPPFWGGQIADILSVAAPDPWTVICYLDVYAFFGLHSMTGFNYILPQHIWEPIILTGTPTPTLPFNMPAVTTGPWHIRSTAPTPAGGSIWLDRNTYHYHDRKPVNIKTLQVSKLTATPYGGNVHWLMPGETATNVNVSVWLHNKYVYEIGPHKSEVFPMTILDGEKNVSLWIWNGQGCPNNKTNYVQLQALATNVHVDLPRCEWIEEKYTLNNLPPWWYFIKVDLHISSLEVIPLGPIPPPENPFFSHTYTYYEFMVVTSRYDFAGRLFKPCDVPKYQDIADLTVDMKDIRGAAKCFGAYPGHPRWNPQADLNGDITIDMKDIRAIAKNFGWTAPTPP